MALCENGLEAFLTWQPNGPDLAKDRFVLGQRLKLKTLDKKKSAHQVEYLGSGKIEVFFKLELSSKVRIQQYSE